MKSLVNNNIIVSIMENLKTSYCNVSFNKFKEKMAQDLFCVYNVAVFDSKVIAYNSLCVCVLCVRMRVLCVRMRVCVLYIFVI